MTRRLFSLYILIFFAISILMSGCTSEAHEGRLKYAALLDDFSEESLKSACIEGGMIDSKSIFYSDKDSLTWRFFDFRTSACVGCGLDDANAAPSGGRDFVNPANTAFTEMYFGIIAEIENGETLRVRSYTHVPDVGIRHIKIIPEHDDAAPNFTYENKRLTADLSDESFVNGLYAVSAVLTHGGIDYVCNIYMIVSCPTERRKDFHCLLCSGASEMSADDVSPPEQRRRLALITDGVSPENALDPHTAYPFEAEGAAPYDTDHWIALSKEITAGYEDTSPSFKALLLHDYMTSHLAYDRYRINALDHPRCIVGEDSNGRAIVDEALYVSKTQIGVCRDFAEIYGIMCRTQGIPALVCLSENNEHAWNAVYLDGKWEQIDITHDMRRFVDTETTDEIRRTDRFSLYAYGSFFTFREYTLPDHLSTQLLH